MFQTINPLTGALSQQFDFTEQTALWHTVRQAESTFHHWKATPVETRSEMIAKIGTLLIEESDRLAKLITLEMGKPILQSRAEISKCALLCEYIAANSEKFLSEKQVTTDYSKSFVSYEPLGVILGIMPWNFPFWQALRFAIPCLAAGNSILLKPAQNVPQCSLAMVDLIRKASGQESLYNVIFIEDTQVAKVLGHRSVQGVALTGSDRAGSSVAALAGSNIKKSVLELGGNDAFVVLEDANVVRAAHYAVHSRMNNTGQTCIAAKRFIVSEKISEIFLEEVFNQFMQLRMGDPMDKSNALGPLARIDLAQNLQNQVDLSLQAGAVELIKGGWQENSNFFRPILLTDIKPGMPAYEQELFGPVGTFFVKKNDEEIIAAANDSPFGLGASIWSSNEDRAIRMAKRLDVGYVAINDYVRSDPRLPFGGVKRSGYGRELGQEGIYEFVNTKTTVLK